MPFLGQHSQPQNQNQLNAPGSSAPLHNVSSGNDNRGKGPEPHTSHAAGDPYASRHAAEGPGNGGVKGDPHANPPAASSQHWDNSGGGWNENTPQAGGGNAGNEQLDIAW